MMFLVHANFAAETIEGDLGKEDYSYYFVLRSYVPVLQALGTVVFGGMLIACIFGTILIPSFYVVIQKMIDWSKGKNPHTEDPPPTNSSEAAPPL